MKRKSSTAPTKIYTYGCRGPVVNGELVEDQFRRAHVYQNKLIEIERARRVAVRAAASSPRVEAAEKRLLEVQQELDQLRTGIQRARQLARKKLPVDPAVTATMTAFKTARTAAYGELREARRVDLETPEVKAKLEAANETAAEAVRQARGESGLYWGTYLLVEKAMEQSRRMPLSRYGKPNDPRFRPWDGHGRIGVQLQKAKPLGVENLAVDTRLRIEPVPEAAWSGTRSDLRRLSHTQVHIRIGSDEKKGPIWGTFTVILHRRLPDDADIKWAWIRRTRVGTAYRYELQITLEAASFNRAPIPAGGVVAFNFGWRARPEGTFRVGYFADDGGEHGEILAPAAISGRLQKSEDLRGIRDKLFNTVKAVLIPWLATDPKLPEWMTFTPRARPSMPDPKPRSIFFRLDAWRSAEHLERIVWRWRKARFIEDITGPSVKCFVCKGEQASTCPACKGHGAFHGIFPVLQAWAHRNRHLYQWEANNRDKAIAHRNDFFRNVAARFRRKYKVVVVDDTDFSELARREAPEADAAKLPPPARHNRQMVAPGELRTAIRTAFALRGDVVTVHSIDITTRCNKCGTTAKYDAATYITHVCDGCGATWDQDYNACCNALHLYASGSVMPGSPAPLAADGDDQQER